VSTQIDIATKFAETELVKRILSEYHSISGSSFDQPNDVNLVLKTRNDPHNVLLLYRECSTKPRRDNSWLTICHVAKDEYFERLNQTISEFKLRHSRATALLREGGIGKSIPIIAENWLESRYLPFDAFVIKGNLQASYTDYLKTSINDWTKSISLDGAFVNVSDAGGAGSANATLNLTITVDGQSADGIAIVDPIRPTKRTAVVNGVASISMPTQDCQTINGCIIYMRPSVPDYQDIRSEDIEAISAVLRFGGSTIKEKDEEDEKDETTDMSDNVNSSEIEIRSNNPFSSNILQELAQVENSDILKKWLDSQVRVNNLNYFTSENQISEIDRIDCFVVLVNPQSKMIHAILSQETAGERIVFGSGERIKNVSETFKNMGVGPIWIQIK